MGKCVRLGVAAATTAAAVSVTTAAAAAAAAAGLPPWLRLQGPRERGRRREHGRGDSIVVSAVDVVAGQ